MLVYGKREYFVIQMLYVCVLCVSCGSFQCCVLHDLRFVLLLFVEVGIRVLRCCECVCCM